MDVRMENAVVSRRPGNGRPLQGSLADRSMDGSDGANDETVTARAGAGVDPFSLAPFRASDYRTHARPREHRQPRCAGRAASIMRLFALVIALTGALLIPFLLWGGAFERALNFQAGVEWLRSWGGAGSIVVVVLLVADLFLPIPATPLMSAAGYLYGPALGGLLSAGGSFLSGMLAYGLCRGFGRGAARRLAGEDELQRAEQFFARRGAWLVVLSRWLPLLPETIACLAGLTRMSIRRFVVALICGCVPMGFAYAAIGATGTEHPALALSLSAIVPAVLWAVVQMRWHRDRRKEFEEDATERKSS
jgi:uncharacterized membrane protein YdjX (TVP38/TMEM64 family)